LIQNRLIPIFVAGLSSFALVAVGEGCSDDRESWPSGEDAADDATAPLDGEALDVSSDALDAGTADAADVRDAAIVDIGSDVACDASPCAKAIASGVHHHCALLDDGTVRCWGLNDRGQLGRASVDLDAGIPPVTGLTDAVAIAASGWSTCALRGNGEIVCWGDNAAGQLQIACDETGHTDAGPGAQCAGTIEYDTLVHDTPVTIALPAPAAGVRVVGDGVCAISADSKLTCWGGNASDNLTVGADCSICPPRRALAFTDGIGVRDIRSSGRQLYLSLALLEDGSLLSWGSLPAPQIGRLWSYAPDKPGLVTAVPAARSFATFRQGGCATPADGGVWCWGTTALGRDAANSLADDLPGPAFVPAGLVFSRVVTSGSVCARSTDGTLYGWGNNYYGELATSTLQVGLPVRIEGLDGPAADVTMTGSDGDVASTCALLMSGEVECWGNNSYGEIGAPGPDRQYQPKKVVFE